VTRGRKEGRRGRGEGVGQQEEDVELCQRPIAEYVRVFVYTHHGSFDFSSPEGESPPFFFLTVATTSPTTTAEAKTHTKKAMARFTPSLLEGTEREREKARRGKEIHAHTHTSEECADRGDVEAPDEAFTANLSVRSLVSPSARRFEGGCGIACLLFAMVPATSSKRDSRGGKRERERGGSPTRAQSASKTASLITTTTAERKQKKRQKDSYNIQLTPLSAESKSLTTF
jgi:hypothetical protein